MSQFYARYVPPSKSVSNGNLSGESLKKRKHVEVAGSLDAVNENTSSTKKSKKSRTREHVADITTTNDVKEHTHKTKTPHEDGHTVLDKYRITEFAKSKDDAVEVRLRKKPVDQRKTKKRAENTKPNASDQQQETEDLSRQTNSTASQKHASIVSKFSKSKSRASAGDQPVTEEVPDGVKPEVHGLEPIPQPEAGQPLGGIPRYSTLSVWQSSAITVEHSSRKPFHDMGLSKTLLANLKKQGLQETFPVQSTVIPILLEQGFRAGSDICISAATGSGKTLAYTIPIIETMRKSKRSGLRAVIVVPTRELVKQVRETCDLCVSGSNLQIMTTMGSKSLSEEQDLLVTKEEVYDPQEYEIQQKAPIDWATFSIEAALERAQSIDTKTPAGFVTRTRLKPDILITTPGRLVDHLKSTPGFHLDDVEWLVIDEADRLLNESYQEWIEAVVPALNSRNATKERDQILSYMHLDLPPRVVRKILLSATMTQDITKLNALGLNDPKLVVLRSTGLPTNIEAGNGPQIDEDLPEDTAGVFNLPATLHETAVTFKDGATKPLILLKLLEQHLSATLAISKPDSKATDDTSSESDSDSDTESSSSSSDSSSSADDSSSDESDTSMSDSSKDENSGKPLQHVYKASISRTKKVNTPRALIFTRSTASASRLSRLLSLLSKPLSSKISTLTRSTASSAASRQALASFRSGRTTILIATDRASRGIDIPGLEHVFNYDIPGSALTYVHRVGRTARAGSAGNAWTLLEHREGRWFWNEIGGKNDGAKIRRSTKVKKVESKIEDAALVERYENALKTLGEEVKGQ